MSALLTAPKLSKVDWSKPAVSMGDFIVLVGETAAARFRRPFAWRELIDQIWFVARVSIVPTVVLSIPYTVLIVFTLNIVLIEVGAGNLSGAGAALASITQVGPVVTAIVVVSTFSGGVLTAVPRAHAVPAPEVEFIYDITVRRQYSFANAADAINYAHGICDKTGQRRQLRPDHG